MYPNTCTKVTIVYFPVFSALFFNGKKRRLTSLLSSPANLCQGLYHVYFSHLIFSPRHSGLFDWWLSLGWWTSWGFRFGYRSTHGCNSSGSQRHNPCWKTQKKVWKNRQKSSKIVLIFFYRNNFDDTEEAIKKRVENYNAKTKSVAQKFNAKVINAERSSDDIFADVQKVMDAM